MVEDITLHQNAIPLAAHLYLPEDRDAPWPAVVTAPGFGGVKEMLIAHYATALAQSGIATLALDYPNFGGSGGLPRQFIDIKAQQQCFQTGLDYLQQRADMDGERLGVWGTSLSGGHTLVVAARDRRVKSALAIIPFIATPLTMAPAFAMRTSLDLVVRMLGGKGATLPIAGQPGEFAAMSSDSAWEWTQAMTQDAPAFRNEVTLSSLLQMARYRTASHARAITVPLKVILATDDSITPARMVRRALAKVPKVEYEEYPQTHFELFDHYLQATVQSTVNWFRQTLAGL
jgi:fermentation-respiration switch protein FrsA (DUF1100 family)